MPLFSVTLSRSSPSNLGVVVASGMNADPISRGFSGSADVRKLSCAFWYNLTQLCNRLAPGRSRTRLVRLMSHGAGRILSVPVSLSHRRYICHEKPAA